MSQYEFVINTMSVSCPECNEVFATQTSFRLPEMTTSLPVESDLHRVLPYGIIRSCLVTICPSCQYAWWTNTFSRHFSLPIGIKQAPEIDSARKFAHAVLTGRKNNFHTLDRAILALNGYWCAKESHQETSKWLILSIQELSAALADSSWEGNRARYHYLLGELLRLNRQFEEAIQEFKLADSTSNLPEDLIINQKTLAQNKNSDPLLLSNEQVKTIFFPALVIPRLMPQELLEPIKTNEQVTENSNSEMVDFGPIQSSTYSAALFPPKKSTALQSKVKATV